MKGVISYSGVASVTVEVQPGSTDNSTSMASILDRIRLDISPNLNKATRSKLGQYFTPSSVANFMAGLFTNLDGEKLKILDGGAGVGSLTTAVVETLRDEGSDLSGVEFVAYEIDAALADKLEEVLACHFMMTKGLFEVRNRDFIEDAVTSLRCDRKERFTHAILNPPYKKINNDSPHRRWLRTVGIETVNLYSAFISLAILLLARHGEIVAIIPRSFCNGPYYKPFRALILRETAIRSIHLFNSRDKAFRDDDVLQENVIIHLERGMPQAEVVISTSSDDSFSDLESFSLPFEEIIDPKDREYFFHIPTSIESSIFQTDEAFGFTLPELKLEVSTGPVVDFRLREYLSKSHGTGMVPLLYPGHFVDNSIDWPKEDWKRANAIEVNDVTKKWLYPSGFYTVVRRFSSKEEKRRINASVVSPTAFIGFESIGFENKLNVFHFRRHGLDELTAFGLAAFLNSSRVDDYFRRFNGHTQVNATDLRSLKYPSIEILTSLGKLAKASGHTNQQMVDDLLESLT